MPRSYDEALELDKKNNNNLWKEAAQKELDQLFEYRTFEDIGTDTSRIPNGFKEVKVKMIFDVKFDLRRKARLVAGGHLTEDPNDAVYSGIASLRSNQNVHVYCRAKWTYFHRCRCWKCLSGSIHEREALRTSGSIFWESCKVIC